MKMEFDDPTSTTTGTTTGTANTCTIGPATVDTLTNSNSSNHVHPADIAATPTIGKIYDVIYFHII